MNCETIDRLLPWFLNGTLSDDEVRTVEDHLESCDGCRLGLAEVRFAAHVFDRHPETGTLVDLVFGQPLDSETRATLEQHLESCAACRDQLALVKDSHSELAGSDHQADPSAAGAVEPPLEFERPRQTSGQAPVHGRWRWAALAASLVGLVALGAWLVATGLLSQERSSQLAERQGYERRLAELSLLNEELRAQPTPIGDSSQASDSAPGSNLDLEDSNQAVREIEAALTVAESRVADLERTLASPRLNTAIIDLFPQDMVLRGDGEPTEPLVIPPGTELATVILNPTESLGDEVTVRLLDAEERTVWESPGLRLDDAGGYVVTLPIALLPADGGMFVLTGSAGESVNFPLSR